MAARAALADAGWDRDDVSDVGMYMGVGASGGSVVQLETMLAASMDTGALSLADFGRHGLRACNPLFAFQLMNNFTMCHAAILSGMRGPNMALFSRGGGTVCALAEAIHALEDPSEPCERALVGGADTALDPVTRSELIRAGWLAEGFVPAEAAGLLALSADDKDRVLGRITRCELVCAMSRGVTSGTRGESRRRLGCHCRGGVVPGAIARVGQYRNSVCGPRVGARHGTGRGRQPRCEPRGCVGGGAGSTRGVWQGVGGDRWHRR